MQLLNDSLPKKLNKLFHPELLSVVVTLLLVPRLRASFRQIVWQAIKHPFLHTRASGSKSQPLLCARSAKEPVTVSCHQSLSWANTTGFVLKGNIRQLCPGVGGKTHMEAGLGARARTGVTLVSTKSYSCPALTPQRSPVSLASAGATAVP